MKISIQMVIMREFGALLLAIALAASVARCGPQPSQGSSASPNASQPAKSTVGSLIKQASAAGSPPVASPTPASFVAPSGSLGAAVTQPQLSGSAGSLANLRDGATVNEDQLYTFDGKNPFSDDSLWRIPIHLVPDSAASLADKAHDQMTKSASEMSSDGEHDEPDDSASMSGDDQQDTTSILAHQREAASGSSAPTVISASTDLKTAAGYHHATPHHGYVHDGHASHYGGHHDAGHHGGHHGGHHDAGGHYGKYFQYASVPYPYAWDFGYRRGNPYHTIERYEHGKGPHFQTKVKWSDKHGGYGVHVWDYNHDDHSPNYYGSTDHQHHHYDSKSPAHYEHGHHGSHYGAGH